MITIGGLVPTILHLSLHDLTEQNVTLVLQIYSKPNFLSPGLYLSYQEKHNQYIYNIKKDTLSNVGKMLHSKSLVSIDTSVLTKVFTPH